MARSDAPLGLKPEEHSQLLVYHTDRLRVAQRAVDKAKEPLKDAQEELTARFNEAKADLGKGYSRKYLTSLLEDVTAQMRDQVTEEARRAQDRATLGLPVYGAQQDLFGAGAAQMPDEARDAMFWELEGFKRGRNGALEEIPDGCPPRFHQAVMKGYEAGQKLTQADLLAAAELKAKMGQPDAGEGDEPDLNAGGEEDQEEALEEGVRKLKRSGFTQRSAPANEDVVAA
ncbi:hypothetical protein [Phenylobacterium conjunctum]|uniref:Uncharacterized protein n=1 Tax=Phenylobacterium conjunctum TaxID=1298959 RepID=A0ABW3T252_9CAUL